MRSLGGSIVTALAVALSIPGLMVLAQDEPAAKNAAAPPGDTAASVDGQPIARQDVVKLISRFEIPPGSEKRAYDAAIEMLVNNKLIEMFLAKSRIPLPEAEVEKSIAQVRKNAESQGSSLENYLAQTNTTLDDLKRELAVSLRWRTFLMDKATDSELKDYLSKNADVFSGTLVRASHILLKYDPAKGAEARAQAEQKLQSIKKEIEAGKTTFADAANKYSEDDGNVAQPSGGDLGLFPRKGQFIEPFARAAFALKKNEISEPVETEYGLHLILITDRREGQPVEFERAKNDVLAQYATDLQSQIIELEKKKAKIEIKPMPEDLFQQINRATPPAAAPGAAPATRPAGAAAK
jgi:peptidyl-prolyl cis-trans isomerase C